MKKLERRGIAVYRLMGFIRWAAFKFLAVTTGLFIWASFHGYFLAKVGPFWAMVLGVATVFAMFILIDKGLDTQVEFVADEKMNPTKEAGDSAAAEKARKWFLWTAAGLMVLRLLATGTTSIWGSFEIAEFVTEKPDDAAIVRQMSSEGEQVEAARKSMEKQLSDAKRTEKDRVKQAKQQGAAMVSASLTHPDPRVSSGFRQGQRWYMTTPKLKKYRTAYTKAVQDSAALVQAEISKVSGMETALADLNTSGLSKSQDIKSQLASVAVKEAENYEAIKGRRTSFLIIADFIAVIMGLIAIATQATFRAAVGRESVLEERTLEGIVWAALKKWNAAFLQWMEKLLGVDIDGDGKIGGVTETQRRDIRRQGETYGATASTDRRKIGFFNKPETDDNDVSDSRDITETLDRRDIARRLSQLQGTLRKYESRRSAGTVKEETYQKAVTKYAAEIERLENLLVITIKK
jgi:hypothetical protein